MLKHAYIAMAGVLMLSAAPVAAQDVPTNSTIIRSLNEQQLQTLVVASGGVWSDLPDVDDMYRRSRVDWPGGGWAEVLEFDCTPAALPIAERKCSSMTLGVPLEEDPSDVEAWTLWKESWLTWAKRNIGPGRIVRMEYYANGATWEHLVGTLTRFRTASVEEIDRIERGNRTGRWSS